MADYIFFQPPKYFKENNIFTYFIRAGEGFGFIKVAPKHQPLYKKILIFFVRTFLRMKR